MPCFGQNVFFFRLSQSAVKRFGIILFGCFPRYLARRSAATTSLGIAQTGSKISYPKPLCRHLRKAFVFIVFIVFFIYSDRPFQGRTAYIFLFPALSARIKSAFLCPVFSTPLMGGASHAPRLRQAFVLPFFRGCFLLRPYYTFYILHALCRGERLVFFFSLHSLQG